MKSNTHKIMTISVLWFRLYLHVKLEKQATLYLCLTELKRCSSLPCAEQKLSRRINALTLTALIYIYIYIYTVYIYIYISHNNSCLILLSIKSPWFYIPPISIGLQFSGVSKKSVHAKQLKKALTSKRFGPTSKAAEWNCFQSDLLTNMAGTVSPLKNNEYWNEYWTGIVSLFSIRWQKERTDTCWNFLN